MRFPKTYRLDTIAQILGCDYVGAADFPIVGMNEIHVIKTGEIVFVDHPKYYDKALQSNASVVLINKKVDCPEGKALLISDDPFRDFNKLAVYFKPFQPAEKSIADTAEIGEGTVIQPNTFIGNNVKIGKNCLIHSNVSIYDDTIIGDNVIIHSGSVLGADAFYYKKRPDHFDQLISSGKVVIEDNVSMGAMTTIDRGVTGETTIGAGSKLDNHVHVGHDSQIGKMCLIASHVGIAGCVIIEDEVTLWGQVGITSGVTIGKKAVVLGQSGVSKNLPGDNVYFGSPAEVAREEYKQRAAIKNVLAKLK
ncbi:UDP-3-O-(3-hydroxymyristoyl)glucosamine N-acyltransferase [Myroides ceti]|uniref:UDP-3-O-(3-hydroxymyristoyl)glucosamine N-acyltransferase n=1 Tax=Paenimyroides ceti TaxID=395087 RepID=A0ABT8CSY7_9FLAO|nr:UDP-3-O-(3-hydroxymyristoyl)glucosamine N-acyltransferase [Paenimyroides ceti]MDN3707355.1 UDP-3-O-(3-hydroxymyristoyl)glucosamine N-acyltransferase [Paenimyroides ceti]